MVQENTEKEIISEENIQNTTDNPQDSASAEQKESGKKEEKMPRKEAKELKKEKERAEKLEKELAEAKEKIAKEKDDYIRLMAEFDNFRRRTAQEKLDLVSTASEETIKGLLPVLDDCERALDVLAKSTDSDAAKEYFSAHYNLFSVCASHAGMPSAWNPKLVKAYRKVISVITHDGHEKSTAAAAQDKS